MRERNDLRKKVRYYQGELAVQINSTLKRDREVQKLQIRIEKAKQREAVLRGVIQDYKEQGWKVKDD